MYADYTAEGAGTVRQRQHRLDGPAAPRRRPENRFFTGSIDDARIYDVALDARADRRAEAQPAVGSQPLAWWDFEDGRADGPDARFLPRTLFGDARIADGRLAARQAAAPT